MLYTSGTERVRDTMDQAQMLQNPIEKTFSCVLPDSRTERSERMPWVEEPSWKEVCDGWKMVNCGGYMEDMVLTKEPGIR